MQALITLDFEILRALNLPVSNLERFWLSRDAYVGCVQKCMKSQEAV